MLFHERYRNLIGESEFSDEFCGYLEPYIKKKLVQLMMRFDELKDIQIDRYDPKRIRKIGAFYRAFNRFQDKTSSDFFTLIPVSEYRNIQDAISLSRLAYIFSIIELQFEELSKSEKNNFSVEINSFFDHYDIKFRIIDGRLIKIDAKQFECDLREKTLAAMKELKDAKPKFQSAYTELTTAIEYLSKGDYQSAINNAEKSYESVLKVILGVDTGNANQLTQAYRDTLLKVPDTMQTGGFESQVMKSLPFIRNNSGADHGAGAKSVVISKPMAKLAVNLAAALDTYLIEEYAERFKSTQP